MLSEWRREVLPPQGLLSRQLLEVLVCHHRHLAAQKTRWQFLVCLPLKVPWVKRTRLLSFEETALRSGVLKAFNRSLSRRAKCLSLKGWVPIKRELLLDRGWANLQEVAFKLRVISALILLVTQRIKLYQPFAPGHLFRNSICRND